MSSQVHIDTEGVRYCADQLNVLAKMATQMSDTLFQIMQTESNDHNRLLCSRCLKNSETLRCYFSDMSNLLNDISVDAEHVSRKIEKLLCEDYFDNLNR